MRTTVQKTLCAALLTLYAGLALLLLGSLVPQLFGYHVRIVESGSMAPTIPRGAAIVVAPQQAYAVGDVVTFKRREDAGATTHRIVDREAAGFVTRGDANDVADTEPVARAEIIGAVRFHLPWLGYLLSAARSPVGFLVLVGVPAGAIVRDQWRAIRREVRAQTGKGNEYDT